MRRQTGGRGQEAEKVGPRPPTGSGYQRYQLGASVCRGRAVRIWFGKVADGEFARLRTVKFYGDALRSPLQMTPAERESFSSDLQKLRTQIEWLSMQTGVSRSPIEIQEQASMKKLLELLAENG